MTLFRLKPAFAVEIVQRFLKIRVKLATSLKDLPVNQYFILLYKKMVANAKVMALATITGMLLVKIPKSNHSAQPVVKSMYIANEMQVVSFVLMVLTACGINEAVVPNAAAKPGICIQSMY